MTLILRKRAVAQHADHLALLHLVEHLAAELEVVALVVDAVAAVALYQDRVIRVGDELRLRQRPGAGYQVDVRHPLEGDILPALRVARAVRARLPDEGRLIAGGLVIDEDAALD